MNNLAGSKGDIFWNMPSIVTYSPGAEIGCVIYVANPTDEEREYSLLARLTSDDTVIVEEAITVFGYSWFKVAAGAFERLHGAVEFDATNVNLDIVLIERESDEETDRVSIYLAEPTQALWPVTWPSGPSALSTGFDWSSLLMVMMLAMVGTAVVSGMKEEDRSKEQLSTGRHD